MCAGRLPYRTLIRGWANLRSLPGDGCPPDASRSEVSMADVIYLALGVGVFFAFAGYAILLRRA